MPKLATPRVLRSSFGRSLLATLLCFIGVASCGSTIKPEETFSLLSGSGVAATGRLAAQLKNLGVSEEGESPRVHRADTPNGALWVAAVGSKLCLFAGHPLALSCSPRSEVDRKGLVLGIVEHPASAPGPDSRRRYVIYGVLPDSRSRVRVKVEGGGVRVLRLHSDAFSLRSPRPLYEL